MDQDAMFVVSGDCSLLDCLARTHIEPGYCNSLTTTSLDQYQWVNNYTEQEGPFIIATKHTIELRFLSWLLDSFNKVEIYDFQFKHL